MSAAEAWRRVTDWQRHADHTPLTTIAVTTPPPTRVGTTFVARTSVGPVGFDDPMEVVRWDPPTDDRPSGHCRLEKRGSVVTGWAEIEVRTQPRAAGDGAVVVWREDLRVRGLPRIFDAPTAWSGRLFFGRAVSGLLGG